MYYKLFEKSVYINRRAVLKKKIISGLIVLMGNEEAGMNYRDNWYPFRQDSTFLYYFGLDVAGLAAIIDADNGEETIYGNELSIDDIVWTGPLPSVSDMASQVGIKQTDAYNKISTHIGKAISEGRKVHFFPPYRYHNKLKLAQWLSVPADVLNKTASIQLIQAVIGQRVYKEACEIEEMDKAVSISADMHLAAMRFTKPGIKEFEIVAKVKEAANSANASMAYGVILTVEGQTLHTHYHGNTVKEGQLILCDAGAENDMHYAGDLTSSFPVGKKFSTRQREIYDIVLQSEETAVNMLKPGVLFRDVHIAACKKIVEGLKSINLMKGDVDEAVNAGAHAMFFQCGVGHMIGLDVHDMEDFGEEYIGYTDTIKRSSQFGLKSLRLGRSLEPGFTLTVEPGIYIIPQLIDKWREEKKFTEFINYNLLESYKDFSGIRIEENYLITEDGSMLLGKKLPKTATEIEAMRQIGFFNGAN